jgi:hypothetical protein
LAVFGLRLGLLALGCLVATYGDAGLTALVLLGALALFRSDHVWLVRAEPEELREQVRMACRGLLLPWDEPEPGRFRLTAKDGTWELRIWPLSQRMQVVVLPRPDAPGKAALLVAWLAKQYPGPVPRVRIVLQRSLS